MAIEDRWQRAAAARSAALCGRSEPLLPLKPPTYPPHLSLDEEPPGCACSGPSAPSPRRITLRTLRDKYKRGEPISMVTAYDYPSAVHVSDLSTMSESLMRRAALRREGPAAARWLAGVQATVVLGGRTSAPSLQAKCSDANPSVGRAQR